MTPSNHYYFPDLTSLGEIYKLADAGKFKLDSPLKESGGTLTIGYGAGGAEPFSYFLREGQDVDVGFLKFFFATKPVDLSKIPQPSPFIPRRAGKQQEKEVVETWGTILIPVVQRRR